MTQSTLKVLALASSLLLFDELKAEECNAILKDGIFEETAGMSNRQLADAFVSWWQRATTQAQSTKRERTHSGRVAFGDILTIKGNFGDTQAAVRTIDEAVSDYVSFKSNSSEQLAQWAKTASSEIAAAWKECMGRVGLSSSIRYTADENVVHLLFEFNPYDAKVSSVSIDRIAASPFVVCDPQVPQSRWWWFDRSLSVGPELKVVTCTRDKKRETESAHITVNASAKIIGGDATFGFPAARSAPQAAAGNLMACATYRDTGPDIIACNTETKPGYYWRIARKLEHYSIHGTIGDGSTPPCSAQSVNKIAMTARFPASESIFQPVAERYTNRNVQMTAPLCNYVNHGVKLDDLDRSSLCGIFEVICLKQDDAQ